MINMIQNAKDQAAALAMAAYQAAVADGSLPEAEVKTGLETRKAVKIITDSAVAVAPKAEEKTEE